MKFFPVGAPMFAAEQSGEEQGAEAVEDRSTGSRGQPVAGAREVQRPRNRNAAQGVRRSRHKRFENDLPPPAVKKNASRRLDNAPPTLNPGHLKQAASVRTFVGFIRRSATGRQH